jgi:hypothetical protein
MRPPLIFCLSILLLATSPSSAEFSLFRDGKPQAVIIVPDGLYK